MRNVLSLVLAVLVVSAVALAETDPTDLYQAKALPSRDLTFSFTQPGTIRTLHVTEGQSVRPGQLLVELDTTVEQAQLAQAQAEADDDTRVRAARARLKQAKLDLDKIRQAAAGGGATEMEVEHARLEVQINELSLHLAEFQRAQARRKLQEMRNRLERMRLRSEVAGRVEKIHLRVGESADALQEVIRVVRVDPLWIDVDVPIARAAEVRPVQQGNAPRPDQLARVRLGTPDADPIEGRIIYKSSVGDAPSGTLVVRIEVDNADGMPAGQFCWIQLGRDPAERTQAAHPGR
jgi:RND family efflux transporter MFP subunit